MSATVIPFHGRARPFLPRINISGYRGVSGQTVYDVELVHHEGQDGFDVLATLADPDEAERFAEAWMAENADRGGGE